MKPSWLDDADAPGTMMILITFTLIAGNLFLPMFVGSWWLSLLVTSVICMVFSLIAFNVKRNFWIIVAMILPFIASLMMVLTPSILPTWAPLLTIFVDLALIGWACGPYD